MYPADAGTATVIFNWGGVAAAAFLMSLSWRAFCLGGRAYVTYMLPLYELILLSQLFPKCVRTYWCVSVLHGIRKIPPSTAV